MVWQNGRWYSAYDVIIPGRPDWNALKCAPVVNLTPGTHRGVQRIENPRKNNLDIPGL
jgi:hypothetical protein